MGTDDKPTALTRLAEAAIRMREALASTGVSVKDIRTPDLSHLALGHVPSPAAGAAIISGSPRGEGPSNPEVTHSGEQESPVTELRPDREPTPEERRDAWLSLVAKVEGWLLLTEQHARNAVAFTEAMDRALGAHPYLGPERSAPPSRGTEEAQARAWAARRLLESVRGLPAPEVPRDDERGQASILELFPGDEPVVIEQPEHPERLAFSTAVEKAGEDEGRPVTHAIAGGAALHASRSPFSDDYSQDWAKVTCPICLQIRGEDQ